VAYAVQTAGNGGSELLIFVQRAAHRSDLSLSRSGTRPPVLKARSAPITVNTIGAVRSALSSAPPQVHRGRLRPGRPRLRWVPSQPRFRSIRPPTNPDRRSAEEDP
jgi:hypothetical protein